MLASNVDDISLKDKGISNRPTNTQRKTKKIDLYCHSLFIGVSPNEQCHFQQLVTCRGRSPTTVLVLVVPWSIRPLTLFKPAVTMGVASNAGSARYLCLHDTFPHGSCFVSLLFLLKGKVQFVSPPRQEGMATGVWVRSSQSKLTCSCKAECRQNTGLGYIQGEPEVIYIISTNKATYPKASSSCQNHYSQL